MGFELGRSALLVSLLVAGTASGCSPEAAAPAGGHAGSSSATGGSVASTAGTSGAVGGAGGMPASGGSAVAGGSAGSAAGGMAGNATGGSAAGGSVGGSAGGGGASSGGGGGASSGGGTGVACPADKTFCSGFEDSAQPTGADYNHNGAPGEWTRDFEVDTTLFHSGKSSLRVKAGSADSGASGAYQMLAVPAPEGAFWVRLYIQQTELDIGGADHNVFGGAAGGAEPNASPMIELAEDVGLAFNTSDDVRWPMNFGRINGNPMPYTLAKGMWHCIEINYDGAQREQKLFVNGVQLIDATSYPMSAASSLKFFKFGFNKLHGPARKVWFDDVAVGPTRAGCL